MPMIPHPTRSHIPSENATKTWHSIKKKLPAPDEIVAVCNRVDGIADTIIVVFRWSEEEQVYYWEFPDHGEYTLDAWEYWFPLAPFPGDKKETIVVDVELLRSLTSGKETAVAIAQDILFNYDTSKSASDA